MKSRAIIWRRKWRASLSWIPAIAALAACGALDSTGPNPQLTGAAGSGQGGVPENYREIVTALEFYATGPLAFERENDRFRFAGSFVRNSDPADVLNDLNQPEIRREVAKLPGAYESAIASILPFFLADTLQATWDALNEAEDGVATVQLVYPQQVQALTKAVPSLATRARTGEDSIDVSIPWSPQAVRAVFRAMVEAAVGEIKAKLQHLRTKRSPLGWNEAAVLADAIWQVNGGRAYTHGDEIKAMDDSVYDKYPQENRTALEKAVRAAHDAGEIWLRDASLLQNFYRVLHPPR